jgi:N-acetyl-gamma-glutamyl-phosphate reductase
MTHTIFIDGEAGTTGLDVLRRLEGRRDLELILLGERRRERRGAARGAEQPPTLVILCLPDEAAIEAVVADREPRGAR